MGVCSFVLDAEIGLVHKKMVVDCALVIASIGETLFQTKQDQTMTIKHTNCKERQIIGSASPLHS